MSKTKYVKSVVVEALIRRPRGLRKEIIGPKNAFIRDILIVYRPNDDLIFPVLILGTYMAANSEQRATVVASRGVKKKCGDFCRKGPA